MSYNKTLYRLASAALIGGVSSPVLAQATLPTDSPGPVAADTGLKIDEIVVVARRQSENQQSVPIAITSFSQEKLTESAIHTAYDLQNFTPGLSVNSNGGNPGLPVFSIRGRGESYGAATGSVETYFAEVPLSSPFNQPRLPVQFFDMASVEVLKGPQGTLFGRNTTGGAVVLVPQMPTDKLEGYARAQTGDYNDLQLEGALNIPIIPGSVELRLSAFYWSRAGYMHSFGKLPDGTVIYDGYTGNPVGDQTFNNEKNADFRAILKVTPSDGLENDTILTYHTDKTRFSPGSGPGLDAKGNTVYPATYGTYNTYTDQRYDRPANHSFAVINTTTAEIAPNLTLKNIFGYIEARGHTQDPETADGVPIAIVNVYLAPYALVNRQYTDEIQLHGQSFGDRLSWTVGGLLDKTREPGGVGKMNPTSVINTFVASDPAHPHTTPLFTRYEQNRINSESIFAAGTFKLTDQLNINAGFRHTWDTVDVNIESSTQSSSYASPVFGPIFPLHYSKGGDTYNLGADYHFTRSTMLYGGYRHGFKRGGFNTSQTNPALAGFDPEEVDDFNIGVKSDFTVAQMPVRLNFEPFYDLYTGLQTSYIGLDNSNVTTITLNVPKTTYRGFDFDTTLKPASWLTLSGSYTFIDTYHTYWPDTTVPGSTINLAANYVPFTSRNQVNVSARVSHDLPGSGGELIFIPSLHYRDKFFNIPLNVILPQAQVNALGGQFNYYAHGGNVVLGNTSVDARIEWNRLLGTRFDLAVNVTNLTDTVRFSGNSQTLQFGSQANTYLPPRMWTIEIATKF